MEGEKHTCTQARQARSARQRDGSYQRAPGSDDGRLAKIITCCRKAGRAWLDNPDRPTGRHNSCSIDTFTSARSKETGSGTARSIRPAAGGKSALEMGKTSPALPGQLGRQHRDRSIFNRQGRLNPGLQEQGWPNDHQPDIAAVSALCEIPPGQRILACAVSPPPSRQSARACRLARSGAWRSGGLQGLRFDQPAGKWPGAGPAPSVTATSALGVGSDGGGREQHGRESAAGQRRMGQRLRARHSSGSSRRAVRKSSRVPA